MTQENKGNVRLCWSCGEPTPAKQYKCTTCKRLQPPAGGLTHFDRFELETRFTLDVEGLTKAFHYAQRLVHPDRFVSSTERERSFALQHSTVMNDAFRILKEPMQRAGYMLKLLGLDVDDDRSIKLSPSFLITILELRESLEELTGPDAHVERRRIQQSVALEYEEGLTRLGTRLDAQQPIEPETLQNLGQLFAQLKYLRRVLEEIERLEAQGDSADGGQLVRLDPLRPETLDRKGS